MSKGPACTSIVQLVAQSAINIPNNPVFTVFTDSSDTITITILTNRDPAVSQLASYLLPPTPLPHHIPLTGS